MDPIEPADPSPGHLSPHRPQPRRASATTPTQETTSSNPPGRPRTLSVLSNRSNRSSIRLYRSPSFTQPSPTLQQDTDNLNLRNNGSRASFATTTVPPPEETSDAFEGGRRRSSSEPRPGRWSAPSIAVLPRLQPGEPMRTVIEEPQSPSSGRRPTSELVRPAPVPTQPRDNRNVLRRTSEAAMNRLTRNRATTVSGASPVSRTNTWEYDPHIVDVLDVIGKCYLSGYTYISSIEVGYVLDLTGLTA